MPSSPCASDQSSSDATKSYLVAFNKLELNDPGTIAAFASHVGAHPEDQLASFHLKRLLNGGTGTRITTE